MDLATFLRAFATTTLCNAAQFAAGGVLALVLCALSRGRLSTGTRRAGGIPWIVLLALCGCALPLGTYGLLPLVVVMGAAGLAAPASAAPASAAFLVSNRFFTMLVPSSDPSFIWRTGYGRPILAVAAGITAGVLLLFLGEGRGGIMRSHAARAIPEGERPLRMRTAASLVGGLAGRAAIALVIGAILQTAFQGYILREVVSFLFANPVTGAVAASFAQRNVVNPLFLLGMWSITVLLDFVGLSGLAVVLKPKGLGLYIVYCAALAAALCSSVLLS